MTEAGACEEKTAILHIQVKEFIRCPFCIIHWYSHVLVNIHYYMCSDVMQL